MDIDLESSSAPTPNPTSRNISPAGHMEDASTNTGAHSQPAGITWRVGFLQGDIAGRQFRETTPQIKRNFNIADKMVTDITGTTIQSIFMLQGEKNVNTWLNIVRLQLNHYGWGILYNAVVPEPTEASEDIQIKCLSMEDNAQDWISKHYGGDIDDPALMIFYTKQLFLKPDKNTCIHAAENYFYTCQHNYGSVTQYLDVLLEQYQRTLQAPHPLHSSLAINKIIEGV
ncbi:conserved hypothetical protein [Coccidioides posadasii str. Silveira]|uniref:Uncharacterized protein n=1 Tax=Coccidioides posadasii (strain RMSCC 757 / Silveira) TaxID=443226 RepID=E9DDM0_COCPS|nr:conserved hypothetical protein [Coccidioides posadasii str. Silveira]